MERDGTRSTGDTVHVCACDPTGCGTAVDNLGVMPTKLPMISLAVAVDLKAAVDRVALGAGVTRSEWIRAALREKLARDLST